MIFVMIKISILNLLLHQCVSSSEKLISKYKILPKDKSNNLMNNFKEELEISLKKTSVRHFTFVGRIENYFERTESLFEDYPRMICANSKICLYNKELDAGNFVMFFHDDINKNLISKTEKTFLHCKTCIILFITNNIISENDFLSILSLSKNGNIRRIAIAQIVENDLIKIYTKTITAKCSIEIKLLLDWKPGTPVEFIDALIHRNLNMNRCSVSVGTFHFPPKMLLRQEENGKMTIAGGLEGNLLLTVAEKINFTINVEVPSTTKQSQYSRRSAIYKDLLAKKTELAIGGLRPVPDLENVFSSMDYDSDCASWVVPKKQVWPHILIWMEFSWKVWILAGLVFIITCVISYLCNRSSKISDRNRIIGIVFDVIAVHLGMVIINIPSSVKGKFLFLMILWYGLIINTAYKSSLASIFTTHPDLPAITDAEGILKFNLTVGGATYNYYILLDQRNESETIAKILDHFIIINNPKELKRRIEFDENFAFIARRSTIKHSTAKSILAGKQFVYTILDECVLYYRTVILFRLEWPLREAVDRILQNLFSSGILLHWDTPTYELKQTTDCDETEELYAKCSRNKFRSIFVCYLICLIICLLTFLIELCVNFLIK